MEEFKHCQYNSSEGCRLIRKIATSRAFNRYRGLYTMPVVNRTGPQKKTINREQPLEDMVQEAFLGMLLYKDDFTGEPGEVIFKAIRKHFKKKYRKATASARDFDNGRQNARIEPRAKPLKVLIDELDYDPAKEPESVKQANNIKNWRIGGITIMNNQKELKYKKPIDSEQWEVNDQGVIYYYDIDNKPNLMKNYKPLGRPIGNISVNDYPCSALWPQEIQPGQPRGPLKPLHVPMLYGVDPYVYSINKWTYGGSYIKAGDVYYKRTQTKTAEWKLKIEAEKPFTRKRNDPLELVSLLHAGFYPEAEQAATDDQIAKQLNVSPSMLKYWRARYPGFYPVFFPQGAPGPLTADPAIKQFIVNHCRQPVDQWVKDGLSYYSSMDRRAALLFILKEALALINTMQQPQAGIMKLYYYQGLTQGEICALLHKSARKVQLARVAGMESIKQHFDYYYPLTDIVKIMERVRKQILNREILPL